MTIVIIRYITNKKTIKLVFLHEQGLIVYSSTNHKGTRLKFEDYIFHHSNMYHMILTFLYFFVVAIIFFVYCYL